MRSAYGLSEKAVSIWMRIHERLAEEDRLMCRETFTAGRGRPRG